MAFSNFLPYIAKPVWINFLAGIAISLAFVMGGDGKCSEFVKKKKNCTFFWCEKSFFFPFISINPNWKGVTFKEHDLIMAKNLSSRKNKDKKKTGHLC